MIHLTLFEDVQNLFKIQIVQNTILKTFYLVDQSWRMYKSQRQQQGLRYLQELYLVHHRVVKVTPVLLAGETNLSAFENQ